MLHIAYWMGVVSAGCTAFYMVRLYWLTFEGKRSKDARVPHAHESSPAMTVPLVILAVLSIVFALHGLPLMPSARGGEAKQVVMENFLDPVFRTTYKLVEETKYVTLAEEKGLPWGVWAQAWLIAIGSGALAWFLYSRIFPAKKGQPDGGLLALTKKLTFNKFYVDEVYNAVLIRPTVALSKGLYKVIDAIIIDTVGVRGTAWLTARTGAVLRYFQTGDAQSYAAVMALALAGGLIWALVRFTVMP
jgi:NADH-quinone oxidoreductase subunit L